MYIQSVLLFLVHLDSPVQKNKFGLNRLTLIKAGFTLDRIRCL